MIYVNGDPVNVTLFPDNTSQVWKLDEGHLNEDEVTILWEYSHEGEIMQLAQLKMLLDVSGVEYIELNIDYLPYGRQDKYPGNDSTFALRAFAEVLNGLKFNRVIILDPHSKIALALINWSKDVYPHHMLQRAICATDSDMFVYPDKGAVEKYVSEYKSFKLPYIYGEKVRDQATGYISSYDLVGNCQGNRVMIVDDICDGGKTFEILAKDLHVNGADEINLFVTHGIFSKGLRPLYNAGINRIFTDKGEARLMPDGGFGYRKIVNAGMYPCGSCPLSFDFCRCL